MDSALHTARNGLFAITGRQAVIANNLANIETTAFKRSRQLQSDFQFPGTQVTVTQAEFVQGNLVPTPEPLDVAIVGDGFLRVLAGGVEAYTRTGTLQLDSEENMVTPQGFLIDPPITVPTNISRVAITPTGTVLGFENDGTESNLGQLEATRFQTNFGLVGFGDNLFLEGPNSGAPISGTFGDSGFPSIHGNTIEQSNVDLATELTDEIAVQRMFQANARAFRTTDDIISETINLVR